MVKKILKIVGVVLLLLVVAAFAIPYLFEDQIKAKIAKAINENVDAKVAFADATVKSVAEISFKTPPKAPKAVLCPEIKTIFSIGNKINLRSSYCPSLINR